MQEKEYDKAVDAAFLDELVKATGRSALDFYVLTRDGKTLVGFPEDVPVAIIDAAVAAHNAQGYTDKREAREARVEQDKAILRQWYLDPTTPARQKALLRMLRYLYGEVSDD